MEEKFYSIDINDEETFFIVKFSGSNGIVYDMSNAHIMTTKQMLERVKSFCDISTACIKSSVFDARLNMYAYHLIADMRDYKQQHVAWIYSPYEDKPWWTVCAKMC